MTRRLAMVGLGCCLLLGSLAPAASGAPVPRQATRIAPGPVVSWGGPTQLQETLRPPADLQDAVAIAASDTSGGYSNLALRAGGTVVGWGLNTFGEATPPAGLSDVVAIDTGAGFSLALRSDGSVVTWGTNYSGQLDVPADLGPVTAVSAGGYLGYRGIGVPEAVCGYALALRPNGTVVRWGQDTPGLGCDQIGAQMDPPADLDGVVAISAGSRQALALRADGTVVAWGAGVSTGLDGTPPAQWSDVVAVSAGSGNSLGLRSDGTVLAYGIWGESGPPRVSDVAALSASNVDVFLHVNGTISLHRDSYPPSAPTGDGFQAVSAGYDYGLAIAAGAAAPSEPLLGSAELQPSVDSNPSGTAEAFQYMAARSGTATALHAYLDAQNQATQVNVGVYPDVDGEPGALLTSGRSTELVAGQWNPIPISPVTISRWTAVLARAAQPHRVRHNPLPRSPPTAGRTHKAQLTSTTCRPQGGLPPRWTSARDFANSPASLYLN